MTQPQIRLCSFLVAVSVGFGCQNSVSLSETVKPWDLTPAEHKQLLELLRNIYLSADIGPIVGWYETEARGYVERSSGRFVAFDHPISTLSAAVPEAIGRDVEATLERSASTAEYNGWHLTNFKVLLDPHGAGGGPAGYVDKLTIYPLDIIRPFANRAPSVTSTSAPPALRPLPPPPPQQSKESSSPPKLPLKSAPALNDLAYLASKGVVITPPREWPEVLGAVGSGCLSIRGKPRARAIFFGPAFSRDKAEIEVCLYDFDPADFPMGVLAVNPRFLVPWSDAEILPFSATDATVAGPVQFGNGQAYKVKVGRSQAYPATDLITRQTVVEPPVPIIEAMYYCNDAPMFLVVHVRAAKDYFPDYEGAAFRDFVANIRLSLRGKTP